MSCRVMLRNATKVDILRLVAICCSVICGVLAPASITWSGESPVTSDLTLETGDALTLTQGSTIAISGDREVRVTGNATINIGASAGSPLTYGTPTNKVILTPVSNAEDDAQLVFNVEEGKTLTIKVWNDLAFLPNATGEVSLFTTFRGKGKTVFSLPSGVTLSFGEPVATAATCGTHVRVLMDQVQGSTPPTPQVVFEKWSYGSDSVNSDTSKHTIVRIGVFSSFIFVSPNAVGTSESTNNPGTGVVAFDPSNSGFGRLIFEIAKGADDVEYSDGGFNIYGSRVAVEGATPTNLELRKNVHHEFRAGRRAIVRIVDDVLKRSFGENFDGYKASRKLPENRRGLVVINNNHSFPRLANWLDQVVGGNLSQSKWYLSRTYQNGFVLGNNGSLEIEQNLFLDYIAGATNVRVNELSCSSSIPHNPSALIVDGLAFNVDALSDYVYNDSSSTARITLIGNAGIYARCGARSDTEAIDVNARTLKGGDLIACTIGSGTYNGSVITLRDETGNISPAQTSDTDVNVANRLGHAAIDIEGRLKIETLSYDGEVSGFINIPSILIDHTGRELAYSSGSFSPISRPLSTSPSYAYHRYNRSSIIVNDDVEIFDTRIIHNDVTRDLSMLPTASEVANPAIIGGELTSRRAARLLGNDTIEDSLTFIDDPLEFSGPALYLYGSTLELHESLVIAGIHLVCRERLGKTSWRDADNTSIIKFYNRGPVLDANSRGRVLQLGSRANTFFDGSSANAVITLSDGTKSKSSLRDAFIDVYRQERTRDSSMLSTDANVLQLSVQTVSEAGVSATQRPYHTIYLANRSEINLGWVTEEVDQRYVAWEFSSGVLADLKNGNQFQQGDPADEFGNRFSPAKYGYSELQIAGDNIYIGAGGRYNSLGQLEPAGNEDGPQGVMAAGGVVYVDHGGKLSTTGFYDLHLNTIIARRLGSDDTLNGKLDLPADQIQYDKNGAIYTYGLSGLTSGNADLVAGNTYPIITVNVADFPNATTVKNFLMPDEPDILTRAFLPNTRATESVATPVALPSSGLFVVSANDTVQQLKVMGATRPNPFTLYVTGTDTGYARIREFVTVPSSPAVLGEGPYAAIFLDRSARIGLGDRGFNEFSSRAWRLLGEDRISIFANGNGVIDLNSDLLVIDKLPIVATENFGKDVKHRLTFYSDVPREIRVPKGCELDLSSFGQSGTNDSQQIAFCGEVRLVIEPGAKIRFPSLPAGKVAQGPILYFNDNAQLIFEEENAPDVIASAQVLEGLDKTRSKILGVGQIWLNKNAQMSVLGNAGVAIEADRQTPNTNITLSLQRQSAVYIGDENRSGGTFQIGNVVAGGGDTTNSPDSLGSVITSVDFSLVINGPRARFHIDREGFFGIGAGVTRKSAGNPNGDTASSVATVDTAHAWQVQSLFNVRNVTLNVARGFFDHNNIFDGADGQASVMALGPLDPSLSGSYKIVLGDPKRVFVRGGGNLVFVGPDATYTNPATLNIWDSAQFLTGTQDTGKYSILSPGSLIRAYTNGTGIDKIDPVYGGVIAGDDATFTFTSIPVTAETQFSAMASTYLLLRMPNYALTANKYIAAGRDQFSVVAGYVNGTTITRTEVLQAQNGTLTVDPSIVLDKGYFVGSGLTDTGAPRTFSVPQ